MQLETQKEQESQNNIKIACGFVLLNFNRLTGQLAQILSGYEIKEPARFSFPKHPALEKRLMKVLGVVSTNIRETVEQAMIANWKLANSKNDILANEYLGNIAMPLKS
jgi:hypothetical protein